MDALPKQIGRFKVQRLLGSGAMGHVYLGEDPELGRAVAIKTVRAHDVGRDAWTTFQQRFRNEARAAARLHHPSIVQVYDVGEDVAVGSFLVFEYVPGSTLKEILKSQGPLQPEAVLRLAEQVAAALDTAHKHGVIHRDIKPDNLLVTREGQAKLADFGVARVPDAALTREGQFLGTPCYSAPETLKEGKYSVQSDLFSFAAVLYEAITGNRAFPGEDAVGVAHKVLHDEPLPASQVSDQLVSKEVDAVLVAGLSKAPSARFASAAELVAALRSAYLREPESVERRAVRSGGSPAPEEGSWGRYVAGAAAVAGVAAAVALAAAIGSNTAAPADPTSSDEADAQALSENLPSRADPTSVPAASDAGVRDGAVQVAVSGSQGLGQKGDSTLAEMTSHEREEAAKDALARTRLMMRSRRYHAARNALEEARRFDPENPDVAKLSKQLDRLQTP